jgi:hypothetical protein
MFRGLLTRSQEAFYKRHLVYCLRVMSVGCTRVGGFQFIKNQGLYMFRALLTYPQEALNKRHLVYCVRIMSVGQNALNMYRLLILNKLNKNASHWCHYTDIL